MYNLDIKNNDNNWGMDIYIILYMFKSTRVDLEMIFSKRLPYVYGRLNYANGFYEFGIGFISVKWWLNFKNYSS